MLDVKCRGLIVADWEELDVSADLARRWVARARRVAPRCAVIFSADQACFGAGLSRLLAAGADAAVERNLNQEQLAGKLRLQMARHGLEGSFLEAPGGQLRLDRRRARLFLKQSGRWKLSGPLSPKELSLLRCFLENPGFVLGRPALLGLLRSGRAGEVNPEAVDKQVEGLRRKLGRYRELITTVYGVGYKFG